MLRQDFQIDWLKSFVAVVDAGSLSAAALLVHRSQSAISMQLKKLESAVGSPLLLRGPRRHELTHSGRTLLGYARRMLDVHAQAQAAFHEEPIIGTVRLGVPDDYAKSYLTPVLQRFAPRFAGLEIELSCEQSTSLIPCVASGTLDLALITRDHARRGTLVFHEPLVWVGSTRFGAWLREPIPVAVYEDTSLARRNAIHSLAQQGRHYRVVCHSSNLAGQIAAVESGLAIAALTQCSVPGYLKILGADEGLGPLAPMEVAVYRSKASQGSKAVDRLQALLVSTLRQVRGSDPGGAD